MSDYRQREPRLATTIVLRTYRADDTMNYEYNTVVTDDTDFAPVVERLLSEPEVATVHVRTLAPQCFLYEVRRGAATTDIHSVSRSPLAMLE